MPRNTITPLSNIDRRAPEAGRIRIGIKSGRAMKSIDTFRFTSPHQDVIEQLADMYGGTAEPWSDDRARIRDQFQVVTKTNQIPVYLPANGLSVYYEKWSGGGCERRCDGQSCEIVQSRGDDVDFVSTPCICVNKGVRECSPYTRLNVVIPTLPFYGTWRLESKGWNALHELPGMFEMIRSLDESGRMVQAMLSVEKRSDKQNGRTRHFVVPKLTLAQSPEELQTGQASVASISAGATAELSPVTPAMHDEIVELLRADAAEFDIDEELFIEVVMDTTNGDVDRIKTMHSKLVDGSLTPAESEGTIVWIKTT